MAKIKLHDMAGKVVGDIELKDAIFGAEYKESLIHQIYVGLMANARHGTHDTKGKGEVRGGGRKPWRQKGTGGARAGSRRSPLWKGGGTTFGPTPRKYTQVLPKTMRHAALRSALSQRVREEAFTAVSEVKLDGFKTRAVVDMLKSLTQDDHSVSTSHTLLLIGVQDNVVMKSAANIPGVEVIVAERVNVVDVVNSKRILATKDAITKLEEVLS
ncbi:MAG: 50S ribosomal protein L4 [Candidatus Eremiobacteraeota bacterium]|nr:50S ribosomal protein L4 [Candidatus Eremiobacteraeota bacterium]MCW5868303.1 50S ribosomal protein L4 [Candidatus Eremiobacteraeota bacterium]